MEGHGRQPETERPREEEPLIYYRHPAPSPSLPFLLFFFTPAQSTLSTEPHPLLFRARNTSRRKLITIHLIPSRPVASTHPQAAAAPLHTCDNILLGSTDGETQDLPQSVGVSLEHEASAMVTMSGWSSNNLSFVADVVTFRSSANLFGPSQPISNSCNCASCLHCIAPPLFEPHLQLIPI